MNSLMVKPQQTFHGDGGPVGHTDRVEIGTGREQSDTEWQDQGLVTGFGEPASAGQREQIKTRANVGEAVGHEEIVWVHSERLAGENWDAEENVREYR